MSFFTFLRKKRLLSSAEKISQILQSTHSIALQRDFVILLLVVAAVMCVITLGNVFRVTVQHTITPFIIKQEERTGIHKVITPVSKEQYYQHHAIAQYLLEYYLYNREQFSQESHRYDYYTTIRALSSDDVYNYFVRYLRATRDNESTTQFGFDSIIHIAEPREVRIHIDSIRPLQYSEHNIPGEVVQVHFVQHPLGEFSYKKYYRIATIGYDFNKTFSKEDEALRLINPLGFRVLYYEVINENE